MGWHLLIYVAAGGALGAMSRYAANVGLTRLLGHDFPYGTLGVNVLGSLLMGLLVGAVARYLPDGKPELHALLAVGFLGSFTTFSAFSLDAMLLLERGAHGPLLAYVLLSVILSVLALAAGLSLMRLG